MPWKAVSSHPDCPGAAVVKSDTGALVACHDSMAEAQAQVRALYAQNPEYRSESRSVEFKDQELKGNRLTGYAAVFDTPWNEKLTEAVGYVERVKRGAFRKALGSSGNVPLLWQHDRNQVLATTNAGTLSLEEDGKGLKVEAQLPTGGLGAYVREMIERGDVNGMSYGMLSDRNGSTLSREGGVMYRTINAAKELLDVSLTWEPSYPDTRIELRTAGFAAIPLQELIDGTEEQIDDAATDNHPPVTADYTGRMYDLRVKLIEKGGWPSATR